jgi:hypothetical protein
MRDSIRHLTYFETCWKEAITDELNPLTMSHPAKAISQTATGIEAIDPAMES